MPTDAAPRVSAFLKVAAEVFGGHPSDIAGRTHAALSIAAHASPVLPPVSHPASQVVDGLSRDPETDLMRCLQACAPDLHWRTAGFGKLPEAAAQHLAVVELIGPAGMIRMEGFRFGLLVQRAGFQYPKHWHAAEELYYVLAGTALWAVDGGLPRPRPPGSFVHHRSMQPHRMSTEAEALLALWAWTGDIGGSSYSI